MELKTDSIIAEKKLTRTAQAVLLQLIDHHNRQTGQCNPRWQTLATEVGAGRQSTEKRPGHSAIHLALRQLKEAGYLTWKRTRGSSHYTLTEKSKKWTSRSPENGHQKSKKWTSGRPYPLYEPYIRGNTASARGSAPPGSPPNQNQNPEDAQLPEIWRKPVAQASEAEGPNCYQLAYNVLTGTRGRGRFLTKAELSQLGWQMVSDIARKAAGGK